MIKTKLRAQYLLFVSVLMILALLSGCGFHLRQSAALDSPIGPVKITGIDIHDNLYKTLARALHQSGIQTTLDAKQALSVLQLSLLKDDRRVISIDTAGKVAEYELSQTLGYQLFDNRGEARTDAQTVSTQRIYTNSGQDVLGKNREEAQLREKMNQALVDSLFRSLSSSLNKPSK